MTERVTAGESFSLTYDVGSNGEVYSARVHDPQGRDMECTVTENAPNVTVSVACDAWTSDQRGLGRVEIKREDTKNIVKRDVFRVMGGLSVEPRGSDYGWRY